MNDQPAPNGADDLNPTPLTGHSTVNVSKIADTLVSQMPQVQEHAITEAKNQSLSDSLKDSKGVPFNETVHAKNIDGTPRRAANGEWAKKRGRKAGTSGASPTTGKRTELAGSAFVGGIDGMAQASDPARTAGEGAAVLLVTIGRTFGGDEWEPIRNAEIGADEMGNLRKAFGDYFVAKNYKDIPPGVALAIAVLGYAGPRCFMPQTRTRLQKAKDWLVLKYVAFTSRKRA
jgi:hypothetical protein